MRLESRAREQEARPGTAGGTQTDRQTNLEGYGQILHIHLAIHIGGCVSVVVVVIAGGHVATSCTKSAAIKMGFCSATFGICDLMRLLLLLPLYTFAYTRLVIFV